MSWNVGDVVTCVPGGFKPRQFRVTAVHRANPKAATITYTVEPLDGRYLWERAGGSNRA